MNIDIRNINSDFENNIKNVMKEFNLKTASKAIEEALKDRERKKKEINTLKNKVSDLRNIIADLEKYKDVFLDFKKLLRD